MIPTQKDRIDVRISKKQKERIKQASELRGYKSLSEFIISCVSKEASRIIQEEESILKTEEDKKLFVDLLLNPPEPNAALRNAHERYKKILESGNA